MKDLPFQIVKEQIIHRASGHQEPATVTEQLLYSILGQLIENAPPKIDESMIDAVTQVVPPTPKKQCST